MRIKDLQSINTAIPLQYKEGVSLVWYKAQRLLHTRLAISSSLYFPSLFSVIIYLS